MRRHSSTAEPIHLPYLDGWRGLAIALVMENHFLHRLPVDSGRLGVDLFFALSGFLMAGILFLQRQPLDRFYKRRISRIFPVFVVYVCFAYGLATSRGVAFRWDEFLSSLAFLRTYWPNDTGIHGTPVGVIIGHTWSLNVEEHAYLLMSLLALGIGSVWRAGASLLALAVACLTCSFVYSTLGPARTGYVGTETAAAPLLLAGAYRLLRSRHSPEAGASPWIAPTALIAGILCYASGGHWSLERLVGPVLLAVGVNHLSEATTGFRALLSLRPLTLLGLWSYSLYLWQQPFYDLRRVFPGGHAAAVAAAVACALVSYYLLERPVRGWLNRHW